MTAPFTYPPGEMHARYDAGAHDVANMIASERSELDAHAALYEADDIYPHLVRAHCTCGWHASGYVAAWIAQRWHGEHAGGAS